MCGRLRVPGETQFIRTFDFALKLRKLQGEMWLEQFNGAPSQLQRIVRIRDGEAEGIALRWGMIPFWAKGIPPKFSSINATVEKLENGPAWRGPWKRAQRCILPIIGFYEWHVNDDGSKQPYYIHVERDSFGVAGIWDASTTEQNVTVESFAIITIPANEMMTKIHNAKARMPAILRGEDHERWLRGSADEAKKLLTQYPGELMEAWPVGTRVNSPKNQGPELIEPLQ